MAVIIRGGASPPALGPGGVITISDCLSPALAHSPEIRPGRPSEGGSSQPWLNLPNPYESPSTERHRLSLLGLELANRPKQFREEHPLGPTSRNTSAPWQSCIFIQLISFSSSKSGDSLKRRKIQIPKFFFFFYVYIIVFRSVRKGGNARGVGGKQATVCFLLHTQEPSSTIPCSASCCSSSSSG